MTRHYSATAVVTSLTAPITNVATSLVVAATTGFPSQFPYTLILDPNTSVTEEVEVTAASGTTLTVIRGVDGTAAIDHSAGAKVEHGVGARDFQEPQNHIAQTTVVHGTSSALVGVSDAQTISNKVIDTSTLDEPVLIVPDIADFTAAQHDHSSATHGGTIPFSSLTGTAGTSFTPAWTVVSGTAPDKGNGILTGRFFQLGKLVFAWYYLAVGSTTTIGSGNYRLSLPVNTGTGTSIWLGPARYGGVGSPNLTEGTVTIGPSASVLAIEFANPAQAGDWNVWGSTAFPANAWAAGDTIAGFVVYEAA